VIVRAARALRHKQSAPSIAPGARPPVISAGSTNSDISQPVAAGWH
jgi:hypothetical protein